MSSLQTLIQSIVTDLIEARFAADVKAAELAEQYRDHPVLQALEVPTLNISNVSVDLRVAFDDSEIGDPDGPSEEQTKAIGEAASALRSGVTGLKSVTDQITVARQRSVMSSRLRTSLINTATATALAAPEVRRKALEAEVEKSLTSNNVRLTATDRRVLTTQLAEFEKAFAAAPAPPPRVPGVVVGSKQLAALDPATVSSIRFDIDLSAQRWSEVDDGTGDTRTVLTER